MVPLRLIASASHCLWSWASLISDLVGLDWSWIRVSLQSNPEQRLSRLLDIQCRSSAFSLISKHVQEAGRTAPICINVTELTDIASVHRQNTGSTTEMVQPVFYKHLAPDLILTTLP